MSKNLKAQSVQISAEIVNSLASQRSFVSATTLELKNQEFLLHSHAPAQPDHSKDLKGADNKNAGQVKILYINKATGQSFTIPVRTLLGLKVFENTTKNVAFDPKTSPTVKVHEYLLATSEGKKILELPQHIIIKHVSNQKSRDGQENDVYPYYMYKKFNERVAEYRKQVAEETGVKESEVDLGPIFQDRPFINSLYEESVDSEHSTKEPNKEIVIAIS